MQTEKSKGNKQVTKRSKSTTRYPKRMPTFVVAFAVHETYDDVPTVQQNICYKRSPSIKSATSSISCETITLDSNPPEIIEPISTLDECIMETKIVIESDNHCGDVEKEFPELINTLGNSIIESNYNGQPEVIFNASKFHKKHKINTNLSKKKPKKCKHLFGIKNIHFKCKNPRNNMTTKLENYYGKTKKKVVSNQMKKGLYINSITNIVSKSRLLKKVLAKENLLDLDQGVSYEISLHENEDRSLTSSPSTAKKSSFSYSSQDTLIRTYSTDSSRIKDYNVDPVNSVIQVSSDNRIPYKTDVLNVAIAVTYNQPKINNKEEQNTKEHEKEKLLFEESLTCTSDATVDPSTPLTSQSYMSSQDFEESYFTTSNLNTSKMSDRTLIGPQNPSNVDLSEDNTYVVAKTSSDFKSDLCSDFTLISNSENIVQIENLRILHAINISEKDLNNRKTLLDTVINMGIFPDINPSTSSDTNYNKNINDVIITGLHQNNLSLPNNSKNKGDQSIIGKDISKNVLKKSYDIEKDVVIQKNINLPNEATIKNILRENDNMQQNSYCDESRLNYPNSIHELWDRLITVLDTAVKRLEDTLADKIVQELTRSMPLFEKVSRPIPPTVNKSNVSSSEKEDKFKDIIDKNKIVTINESLQCDLVENRVIDNIMLKLSIESPNSAFPQSFSKSIKNLNQPQLVKDFLEVLKPPIIEGPIVETSKDEIVTVSTAAPDVESIKSFKFQHLKLKFAAPVRFIRENWLVISSVPTFFVLMLCIYGVIVFLVKPW
ncbi:uncharacterized protein ACR2FA_002417 [Aphomia sociella]